MGVFKGTLTVRRYRVAGEIPDDFRTLYQEALTENAFQEPFSATHEGEVIGWVQVHNLLETDFSNMNQWLYNNFLVAALRVDRKVLPSKLFKAWLDKRCKEWCAEQQRDHCPARVRSELRETLTLELLPKTLPRVQLFEFCWNILDGWVMFLSTSESGNDKFRKAFRTTFGLNLLPWSPLDFLENSPDMAAALQSQGLSNFRRTRSSNEY